MTLETMATLSDDAIVERPRWSSSQPRPCRMRLGLDTQLHHVPGHDRPTHRTVVRSLNRICRVLPKASRYEACPVRQKEAISTTSAVRGTSFCDYPIEQGASACRTTIFDRLLRSTKRILSAFTLVGVRLFPFRASVITDDFVPETWIGEHCPEPSFARGR